jgi:hypothetical protein
MITRYHKATRQDKTVLLNEFCAATGYNRSYAATLLRTGIPCKQQSTKRKQVQTSMRSKGGRPCSYGKELQHLIERLWKHFDFLCGKRLVPLIRTSLPVLRQDASLRITQECAQALVTISPATVDRLLAPVRKKYRIVGRSYTRSTTSLKDLIPVRTWSEWKDCVPGHLQIDTVGHDGGYLATDCSFSLCATDVCTGWTERYAMQNRAFKWVHEGLDTFKKAFPFPIVHLHPDGGSEFINHAMVAYCNNAEYPIQLTRSRPGKKNDNCYVEQKNFDAIRKLLGYARYPTQAMLDLVNELYTVHGLLRNYFYPSQKLIEKVRKGSKVIKRYDTPQSPADRLLTHANIGESIKETIRTTRASLNPVELAREVDRIVNRLQQLLQTQSKDDSAIHEEKTGS